MKIKKKIISKKVQQKFLFNLYLKFTIFSNEIEIKKYLYCKLALTSKPKLIDSNVDLNCS
ncbi:hypothetical protein BpHYR1_044652 [Brachionus plicatilis]|uniref:Uncharacterized protein n=1 Tax=Brachionus plicatilis TaxID=10195 RepID=A0A3M7T690_BRAPC|nr:hypothetical protein BpHYR1_044652 [Brachionus plicatilis]